MTHKGTVTLETERLLLRRFKRKDLEQIYYNCWVEKEVWGWTNYAPMNCIAEVLTNANMFTDNWMNAYERENRYSWAIQLKESGEKVQQWDFRQGGLRHTGGGLWEKVLKAGKEPYHEPEILWRNKGYFDYGKKQGLSDSQFCYG